MHFNVEIRIHLNKGCCPEQTGSVVELYSILHMHCVFKIGKVIHSDIHLVPAVLNKGLLCVC